GLGTYGMGGFQGPDRGGDDEAIEAIRYGIRNGISVIDTAEMYGSGHTEEVVGEAIKGFSRERVYIISKVWPTHLARDHCIDAAMRSLKRLKTDYIDLYLIHWPNPEVPLAETLSAMMELREKGYIRGIGVSNFDQALLQEAFDAIGKENILANEIEYNLNNWKKARNTVEFCLSNGVAVIGYSPLARGSFKKGGIIRSLAEKYNATPAEINLRLLMEDSLPIPKASRKDHIDEIVRAAGLNISREDISSAFLRI
ncbi:MAG TPA: aldo/keto reductase, partial [Thermoplasmataceae archaeon]|nr:aldo/keto reductase [Thermoplasmataceae archaeon]